jgi:glycerol-3-phosphate acyltransferase PlsY
MYLTLAAAAIGAYLIGSIPFGLLIAGAHGKDLRSIGSGNIGATNVSRAIGRKWGYLCFVLDVLKGSMPVLLTGLVLRNSGGDSYGERIVVLFLWVGVGVAAVVGHVFPIYLRFKGGKGVATSFGVALGLWPYLTVCAVIAILVWLAVVFVWRYVSLASIVAAVSFPTALVVATALLPGWKFSELWPLLLVAVAIPVMVILRHRENIGRLLAGTESKIPTGRSKTPKAG